MLALCDGGDALVLAPARDFKRAYDGDVGPNTGGMGSFAPVPGVGDEMLADLLDGCIRPILAELARRGMPFVGTLFAGLMLTADGPRVLEYNCRFGDPETQSVLPLVEGDLLGALAAAAAGSLAGCALGRAELSAVTVVLSAGGYPETGDVGTPIDGIDEAEAAGGLVFQAGTALAGGRLVTNGGRLLGVTATGSSLVDARAHAYAAADRIRIDGARRREDIALEADVRSRVRVAAFRNVRAFVGAPQPTTHYLFYRQTRQQS